MYQIELDKAKSQIEALIQTALDGQEVVITRNDEPVPETCACFKVNYPSKSWKR